MISEAAMNEARDHLFRAGHPNVTRADALIEISRRSLSSAGSQRAERFTTYIHVDAPGQSVVTAPLEHEEPSELQANGMHANGLQASGVDQSRAQPFAPAAPAVLSNGLPVPPSVRDYLTYDSLIQVMWHQGTQPVGVGRTSRTVPNRLRRLVELRDQGCCVSGCTNTLGLQVHHVVAWSTGGVTELSNLVLVCDAHHHQHHSGDITIAGNPEIARGQLGSLTVTDRHGRRLRRHPTPRPPNPSALANGARYQHPSGERCNFAYLGWRPPPAA